MRPDILIKKNNKNWSVSKCSPTIGWRRDLIKNDNYLKTLCILSQTFKVPLQRTFYIFEAARNVNRHFYEIFEKNSRDKMRDYIYPLFLDPPHPFFLSKGRGIEGINMKYSMKQKLSGCTRKMLRPHLKTLLRERLWLLLNKSVVRMANSHCRVRCFVK